MLEHTIRLPTLKTIYLYLSLFTCTLLRFISSHAIYIKLPNFIRFSLEIDDMESSKPFFFKFLSLIFIIRCLSKSFVKRLLLKPKQFLYLVKEEYLDIL